jgi:hypothetical protein
VFRFICAVLKSDLFECLHDSSLRNIPLIVVVFSTNLFPCTTEA